MKKLIVILSLLSCSYCSAPQKDGFTLSQENSNALDSRSEFTLGRKSCADDTHIRPIKHKKHRLKRVAAWLKHPFSRKKEVQRESDLFQG